MTWTRYIDLRMILYAGKVCSTQIPLSENYSNLCVSCPLTLETNKKGGNVEKSSRGELFQGKYQGGTICKSNN